MRHRLRHRPHIRPTVYGYLTEEKESLRQGFAALFLSSVGELIAGLVLASITETLDQLVGLAVLIPAAIGMRGAIFGAMGSRLSTAIQTGLFSFNLRRGDYVVGQIRPAREGEVQVEIARIVLEVEVVQAGEGPGAGRRLCGRPPGSRARHPPKASPAVVPGPANRTGRPARRLTASALMASSAARFAIIEVVSAWS